MKTFRILSGSILPLVVAGCGAAGSGAPVIGPEMMRVALARGETPELLAEGRRLLVTRCISCHGLEPVAKYTSAEWREIVDRMADRSGLDAGQAGKISSYLSAARDSPPQAVPAGSGEPAARGVVE